MDDRGQSRSGWRGVLGTALSSAVAGSVALAILDAPRLRAAQTPAGDTGGPRFEVASVKPNKTTGPRLVAMFQVLPGGRFDATLIQLRGLVLYAYSVTSERIVGGPSWASTDRFDIAAKAEGDPSAAEMKAMVRALLADRFKLVAHTETRELPMFALLLNRSDGKLGSQLRAAVGTCPAGPSARIVEASETAPSCGIRRGLGRIEAWGIDLVQLANLLRPIAQAASMRDAAAGLVVDRTGLTGHFDLDLQWDPNATQRLDASPAPPERAPGTGTSIFTAVRDQLGLKLDPQKAPIEVVVIDSAEKPMED
jgi:bla regulator protein blaR1